MPRVAFTAALQRHVGPVDPVDVGATTLSQALDQAFVHTPALRSYVLDDQGRIRRHVAVFVDGELIADRTDLAVPLGDTAQVYVMQALSGG